jgi:hypothetical protein
MEHLPLELRQQIIQYLELEDLKSIRLASLSWALAGQGYLLKPTFHCLLYRDDFNRLLGISRNPYFSPIIEQINFDMGEINEYYAQHNTYFVQYMKDPEDRDEDGRVAWAEYNRLKAAKEACAYHYCSRYVLIKSFKNLPNLKTIDISMSRCPFDNHLLQRIWKILSTRLHPRAATTERFTDIVCAARHIHLESLTHDRLPVEFWMQRRPTLTRVAEAFRNLHTLKICSEYSISISSLHREAIFKGLYSCLRAAPLLRTLHIGFRGPVKPEVNLSDCDGGVAWQHLHTFALEGMVIGQDDLVAFLLRHKSSLKRLQLGGRGDGTPRMAITDGIQLHQGTLRGLMESIKGEGGFEAGETQHEGRFEG